MPETRARPAPAARSRPPRDALRRMPDLSTGGSLTIESSGQERDFTLVLPDPMPDELLFVFFFHGITNEGPDRGADAERPPPAGRRGRARRRRRRPGGASAEHPRLQLPPLGHRHGDRRRRRALRRPAPAIEQHLWTHRVVAAGFSGGSLFTTVIAAQRGDLPRSSRALAAQTSRSPSTTTSPASGRPSRGPLPDPPGHRRRVRRVAGRRHRHRELPRGDRHFQDHLVAGGHDVVRCDHGWATPSPTSRGP